LESVEPRRSRGGAEEEPRRNRGGTEEESRHCTEKYETNYPILFGRHPQDDATLR
jgi:hypothetical protein